MVHAVETNLQRLLEGTKQYQVPLYQRTYSWRNAQPQRLWDDIVKLAEDRSGSSTAMNRTGIPGDSIPWKRGWSHGRYRAAA